jgi:hypothetical protein
MLDEWLVDSETSQQMLLGGQKNGAPFLRFKPN